MKTLTRTRLNEIIIQSGQERKDVHREIAAEIFSVTPENVTDEQRKYSKTIMYSHLYTEPVEGFYAARDAMTAQMLVPHTIPKVHPMFPPEKAIPPGPDHKFIDMDFSELEKKVHTSMADAMAVPISLMQKFNELVGPDKIQTGGNQLGRTTRALHTINKIREDITLTSEEAVALDRMVAKILKRDADRYFKDLHDGVIRGTSPVSPTAPILGVSSTPMRKQKKEPKVLPPLLARLFKRLP